MEDVINEANERKRGRSTWRQAGGGALAVAAQTQYERKKKSSRGGGQGEAPTQDQKPQHRLDDIVVMVTRELLMLKQQVGALNCSSFVVILRDDLWKKHLAKVCEGWVAKQQEQDNGAAHPRACFKRAATFGCVIMMLHKAAMADSGTAPANPGWAKPGFAEMARCKLIFGDTTLGSFKPTHPTPKDDRP